MKYRSVRVGLAVLAVLASFPSCKPARSELGTSGEPGVSDLKIGFVVSESGSAAPDFERPAPTKLLEGAMREGHTLQLKKRVAIPGRLFLTLGDSVGTRKIQDASYEHQILSPSNVLQTNGHRALLSYDHDQRRYLISLDELSGDVSEGLSSLDLQILDLTLNWNDGSTSHFEVRFYVSGELPSADQIRLSQVLSEPRLSQAANGAKLSAQATATQEGWTVLQESYKNPTSRPLILWFSGKGVSYHLITELGMKLDWSRVAPAYRPANEAGFEPGIHQLSEAPLERMILVIRDPLRNKTKTVSIADTSVPVRIAPGQTLELEWRALASQNPSLCKDGAPASRTYKMCNTSEPGKAFAPVGAFDCKKFEGMYEPMSEPGQIQGIWAVQEYRVRGGFQEDVVLTEEIGSREQNLKEAIHEGIALALPGAPPATVTASEWDSAQSYSCQGIF